jgi:tetratricopeptide (TPR) repeat protein
VQRRRIMVEECRVGMVDDTGSPLVPADAGAFEIFISYARRDNEPCEPDGLRWITVLRDELVRDHRRFSTEPLKIFFDLDAIRDMDDWRHRILEALRHSRILLVCISPRYFASEYCFWEWQEYQVRDVRPLRDFDSVAALRLADAEVAGEPAASIEATAARTWYEAVRRPKHTDVRPWFQAGPSAATDDAFHTRLHALGTSLWSRLARARRANRVRGNIRRVNAHFVGRRAELRRLHECVGLGAVGGVTVVHGLGGQGKTELAVAYAHGWADEHATGMWLFAAEGRKELLPLLGDISQDLGLPADGHETPIQRGRRVLAELERLSRDDRARRGAAVPGCLLVFDNVSEPELLSAPQLSQLPAGDWLRVLVTTRLGPEVMAPAGKRSLAFVAVDALDDAHALRLLAEHQPGGSWPEAMRPSDAAAAARIVQRLGGFTLAIEAVAIYLGLHPELRPAAYLRRLERDGLVSVDALAGQGEVGSQMHHREKQLAIVLAQTLEGLTDLERDALDLASLLPADEIPWRWLVELVVQRREATAEGYPDPWATARRRLEGLRLLGRATGEEVARMHQLVSSHLRSRMSAERQAVLRAALSDLLCDPALPFRSELSRVRFGRIWGRIDATGSLWPRLLERAATQDVSPEIAEYWAALAFQLGNLELEQWWVDRWAATGAVKSHELARQMASLAHRHGHHDRACAILEDQLAQVGDDFKTASWLVVYLAQRGSHADASALAERLERDHAALLRQDARLRADLLYSQYFCFHDLDRNDEAVGAMRAVSEVFRAGHQTYDFLMTSVNLGDALWAVGSVKEAEDLLRKTLAEASDWGLVHVVDIAATCLANVLSSAGRRSEARELYVLGVAKAKEIGHDWDVLYGQIYQALLELEDGDRGRAQDLLALGERARCAGFGYLAQLADAHLCTVGFHGGVSRDILEPAIERSLRSGYPAARLYARSAVLQLADQTSSALDPGTVRAWVDELGQVQGLKGRSRIIAQTAELLLGAGALSQTDRRAVQRWVARYLPGPGSLHPHAKVQSSAAMTISKGTPRSRSRVVRLRVCNLDQCEARCCYDGVYLMPGEEEKIRAAVEASPELFRALPSDYIVEGTWAGKSQGRKTATRPHDFKSQSFPAHFTRTRCVFCADDHRCLLQVAAVRRRLHKWTYKPAACWMFPMRIVDGAPAPPPARDQPDPDALGPEYPGYTKFVPCGQDCSDGLPWKQTLRGEIEYFARWKPRPDPGT